MSEWRALALLSALVCGSISTGCATGPRVAPPEEIPDLQRSFEASGGDPDAARDLAASFAAADRCEDAVTIASTIPVTADRSWPVLIEGRCLEEEGGFDEAIAEYDAYLARYPDSDGSVPVRGQSLLARERRAVALVAGEAVSSPATSPPDDVLAVLPLDVSGPEEYGPLGRGLAAQITSDLLLVDRFRLVERMEMQAVADELQLSRSELVDPQTQVRLGRIVRAGQVVGGDLDITTTEAVGIQGALVRASGEVFSTARLNGEAEELLRLEKDLVIEIIGEMGHVLTTAERNAILNNGTENLQAFLAYSRGLELLDGGEYEAAAASFAEAQRLDPTFSDAGTMLEGSVGAGVMQSGGDGAVLESPGEISETVERVAAGGDPGGGGDPLDGMINASVNDIASTQGEQAVGTINEVPGSDATDAVGSIQTPIPPPLLITFVIVFRLPGGAL